MIPAISFWKPNKKEEHLIIRNLWETYESIQADNYQEMYHDAIQFKEEAINLFNFGYLSLIERAKAEKLYWSCCLKISQIIETQDYVPEDLQDLSKVMASTYYVNLSVFQSAPDTWAIQQVFPIIPIHRLNEKPTVRAILADITCDSDGKIDFFIDLSNVKNFLEVHTLKTENSHLPEQIKPYYLGMFLVGAYQEIMGNLHNLFGDVNLVHIQMKDQEYEIKCLVKGDTVKEVLGYVEYDPEDLLESLRCHTEKAVQEKAITLEESQRLLENYQKNLSSYTYLA